MSNDTEQEDLEQAIETLSNITTHLDPKYGGGEKMYIKKTNDNEQK